jgi:hypothetical protein
VPLVAELDRLLARDAGLGHPGRAVDRFGEAEQPGNEEDGAENGDARERVGASVEDLRHPELRGTPVSCRKKAAGRCAILDSDCAARVFISVHRFARVSRIVVAMMRNRIVRSLLWTVAVLLVSMSSFAQGDASITIAPPELPVYEQPVCPGDGYIWTPGYWAWDGDYYWVPGTWVMPPEVGFLWTPGYWGWGGGGFLFNDGYWGASVGFYGGVDYGFGYFGHGYEGGRWDRGHFFYNTTLNHINVNLIHNVYNTRVNETTVSHVSYSGGNGGITAHATAQEDAAAHSRHLPPVAAQTQHAWTARNAPQQRLSANHGAPPVVATPRANMAVHPNDLPPVQRAAAPNTGNPNQDRQYQKEQDQLVAKQTQDRQALQQKQDQEHQRVSKQADPAKVQQAEQRHQQQTQQMQQGHDQQRQQMQQRQQPQGGGGSRGGRGR